MSADPTLLSKLVDSALARGATKAAVINVSSVVTDIRVGMKCQVPICKSYGNCLMCPPYVLSPADFAAVLTKYSDALLIQWAFAPDKEVLDSLKGITIADIDSNERYESAMKAAFRMMAEQLNDLEGEAMRMGFRFATAFGGGPCCLCDECVGGDGKCRHPFKARPGMEAVGIDVIATCEKGGLPIRYPAEGSAMLTGLLLVD
ncbi:MAG TPA: DUF2284 domain-containing protein [Methanomassiliicoccales archaeon]|nr:DUF2284 domain-containing protein [Methanomassiliicoccales archaeon]